MKLIIQVAILSALAAPAYAGILPAPVMGDSLPGIVVVALLSGGYFLIRYLRKRSHS